jgi:hypothetical protein
MKISSIHGLQSYIKRYSGFSGKTINSKDIVFSEPQMDLPSWYEKCKEDDLSNIHQEYIIQCADHYNRTLKDYVF